MAELMKNRYALIEISCDAIRFFVADIERGRPSSVARDISFYSLKMKGRDFQNENKIALNISVFTQKAQALGAYSWKIYFSSRLKDYSHFISLKERLVGIAKAGELKKNKKSQEGAAKVQMVQLEDEKEGFLMYKGGIMTKNRIPERSLVLRLFSEGCHMYMGNREKLEKSMTFGVNFQDIGNRLLNGKNGSEELKKQCHLFEKEFASYNISPEMPLIGQGEALSCVAMLNLQMPEYGINTVHGSRVKYQKFDQILRDIMQNDIHLRRSFVFALSLDEAIMMGQMCFIRSLMLYLGTKRILLSETPLLMGVMGEIAAGTGGY